VSLICLAVSAGFATAQEQPPKQDKEAEAEATPPQGSEEKPDATPADKSDQKAEPAKEPDPLIAGETAPSVGTTRRQPAAASGADRVTTGGKVKPGKSRKYQPKPRSTSRSRKKPSFKTDPNAKWICEQTVCRVDPVWRGNQKLTFDFYIRNDGTADLRMKAKGG
jgi:hypothetical protein